MSLDRKIPKAIADVAAQRAGIIGEMQKKYPGIRLQDIGEIGYRCTRLQPEEIISQGGFVPREKEVYIATASDSPNNKGLIDFSLVPEVTTIFSLHKNSPQEYIYAVPLDKGYLMKGPWRQVAVPALPLPPFLVAREIISKNGSQATLGGAFIIGEIPRKFAADETLRKFMSVTHLDIPQDIGLGDEHTPPHYHIEDTQAARRLFPQR